MSFSLRFAENMLIMSLGSFQNAPSSICRVITFYIFFSSIFLLLNAVNTFNMSSLEDQVSNFIVNNAYSGQT